MNPQVTLMIIILIAFLIFLVVSKLSPWEKSGVVENNNPKKFGSKLEEDVWNLIQEYIGVECQLSIRPDWLPGFRGRNLELDIYCPTLKFAIEIQGEQHFNPRSFSGNDDKFSDAYARDMHKVRLCAQHNIDLFHVLYIHRTREGILKQLSEEFTRAKRKDLLDRWPVKS